MFRLEIDGLKEIDEAAKEYGATKVDVQKLAQWYINQVYADVYKQNSRPYTYTTPPGDRRTVLRKRSGELLLELKNSKFVDVTSSGEVSAGFDIPDGSMLNAHEGSDDPNDTIIRAKGPSGYMVIPLRAALGPDGSPASKTARHYAGLVRFIVVQNVRKKQKNKIPTGHKPDMVPIALANVEGSGENVAKLIGSVILGKRVGRKVVPYYLLAKEVHIPKRLFLMDAMNARLDDLYERINDAFS